ncbi:MAG: serine hydrolase domain-containing protein [Pyrinomonadaceae bacterium]
MNQQLSNFLRGRIKAGDFPSAAYFVAENGRVAACGALGYAVVEPERVPAQIDTIYDVASLTKPLITGLLCAKMIERGDLRLDDKIEGYLPSFETNALTVRHLVTHTSGFKPWRPFYLDIRDTAATSDKLSNVIARLDLVEQPGKTVIYSDLNFIALQAIIENKFRSTLERIADDEIFRPLGLKNTGFNPSHVLQARIAASEKGNEYEKQTCIDLGFLASGGDIGQFREDVIWGKVHDGNAYFMGGIAGHAGLFSTTEEIFKIGLQFLPEHSRLLSAEACDLFKTNFTSGMNEARSLSFQLAETPDSTAGNRMSPQSFGHLGFTGSSIWVDPVNDRIFVLLTNRTHGHELPFANINSTRRTFHEISAAELEKKATKNPENPS